jgi:hypothetical protein
MFIAPVRAVMSHFSISNRAAMNRSEFCDLGLADDTGEIGRAGVANNLGDHLSLRVAKTGVLEPARDAELSSAEIVVSPSRGGEDGCIAFPYMNWVGNARRGAIMP